MTYQLRDYQSDLLDRIESAWFAGNRSILCQLPTGAGKTLIFSTVVDRANKKGLKCLVLAHREELIKQAADKLEIITNDPVGIIKAGYPTNYDRDIQVASVQSLTRRLNHCPQFDLIIVEEAHHSTSNNLSSMRSSLIKLRHGNKSRFLAGITRF
jgi:superfamily II DNA or RNA helicase